jgi:DNA damage-inducible protein 1
MLYITVEVNGVPVKAMVDCGAQSTVMTPDCAERCNIMRLLDRRFAGEARGAGTAKILGRVHAAQMKIGQYFMSASFSVMEGKDIDILLGLDMLKRYQACIDLKKGVLRIMDEEVPFLGESEVPKAFAKARERAVEGPTDMQAEVKGSAPASATGDQTKSQASGSAPGLSTSGSANADKIRILTGMGFSEREAAQALEIAGGDVEVAASFLYGA